MAITASFATGTLSILGDSAINSIIVSRNAAGVLRVNNGAVPISGGPATTANTSLISIIANAGADTVTIDESGGAMPAVNIDGGAGNDTLTGGSMDDELVGGADNDLLFGRGGSDSLFGGIGNDTLTGGDGDDQLFGDDGDDLFIWNPGDDSDLMEGGIGTDTVQVNGGNGAEIFAAAANGTRVRFDRVSPAPFVLDIGTSEKLVLNLNGGDDSFSATGNLAALTDIQVDGGTGDDTILGSNGYDTLLGGDDDDLIDGQQGSDTVFLGAGNDTAQWDPGDGSDIIEGQAGTDTLRFNGSAANEIYGLFANGGRVLLTRNVGSIVMDMYSVEAVRISAAGGTDAVSIGDLTGTGVKTITVNLEGAAGSAAADGAIDTITVAGGEHDDSFTFNTNATLVDGAINILAPDATDTLSVTGGEGNDRIDASRAPGIALTIMGGEGNDTLYSSGDGLVDGGEGNDTILAGLTNAAENLDGGTGIDTLDTTSWAGFYVINLATGTTNYSGESFTNFENVTSGGGSDTITGTDGANRLRSGAGADSLLGMGGADRLEGGDDNDTLDGGSGADTLDGGTGSNTLIGGTGGDLYIMRSTDVVDESTGGGNDTIQAGFSLSLASLATIENLTLTGSSNLTATGNALGNVMTGNTGNNTIDGGTGKDTMAGLAGNDVYRTDSSADVVQEASNAGIDRVESSATFTLSSNVENLTLTGARSVSGTGNSLANTVTGNTAHNLLSGNDGNDILDGGSGNDTLNGGNDNDSLLGGAGNDSLLGGNGNDTLKGSSGTDVLNGGGNDDFLDGGLNNDTMTGGAGRDRFSFTAALGSSNIDTITDFVAADDTIRLDDAIFTALTATGTLAAGAFRANTTGNAQATSDRIVYETDTGRLFYDADGTGATARILFAVLDTKPTITNADFLIA